MNIISVVMAAHNAEDTIAEAVESVLNQSFTDFEVIIVNDGSTDCTCSKIRSYSDSRIRLIEHERDYAQSLNTGLNVSKGKYIARMDTNDRMHVDRLKIQHSIMESFPEVTVCSCNEIVFGEKIPGRVSEQKMSGLVESPLIQLLLDEKITTSAYMIRHSFITTHHLLYKNFPYAEDYRFLTEAAKWNGIFYIESQPLEYRRISDVSISRKRRLEMLQSFSKIKMEILSSLCGNNKEEFPALQSLHKAYDELLEQNLITVNEVIRIFNELIKKNEDKMNINNVCQK